MRVPLLRIVLALAALGVAWLFLGRQLTLLADRITTVRMAALPARPVGVSELSFEIGGRGFELFAPDGRPVRPALTIDSAGRVVLATDERRIALGVPRAARSGAGVPRTEIVPDDGDEVAFTLERSALPWPTPLQMNFVTGHAPSWKRNLYYRLAWTKRSGARLDARWRLEQWYYGGDGWGSEGGMTSEGATGLVRLAITPERGARE